MHAKRYSFVTFSDEDLIENFDSNRLCLFAKVLSEDSQ